MAAGIVHSCIIVVEVNSILKHFVFNTNNDVLFPFLCEPQYMIVGTVFDKINSALVVG